MTAPDVSILVVSHNGPEWLERSLRALLDEARPTCSFELIVVDSASQEPTKELLAAWQDRATVIWSEENIGFARGCNLAARRASGDRLLLLNPDAVVETGCVDNLVEFLDARPGAGLVGGRTMRPDGRVDPGSCWGRPTLWSTFCFAVGLSTAFRRSRLFDPESLGTWERDSVREVDIVTGCLLMMTRETWDRLGGFDEDFFMYAEDADLSLRAAEVGLRPAITPDAIAIHAGGASSGRRAHKNRLLMTGKATLIRKRWSGPRARAGLGLLLVGAAIRAADERVRRTADPSWLPLVANRSWLRGWPTKAGV